MYSYIIISIHKLLCAQSSFHLEIQNISLYNIITYKPNDTVICLNIIKKIQ